jgi:hypothetical protein
MANLPTVATVSIVVLVALVCLAAIKIRSPALRSATVAMLTQVGEPAIGVLESTANWVTIPVNASTR